MEVFLLRAFCLMACMAFSPAAHSQLTAPTGAPAPSVPKRTESPADVHTPDLGKDITEYLEKAEKLEAQQKANMGAFRQKYPKLILVEPSDDQPLTLDLYLQHINDQKQPEEAAAFVWREKDGTIKLVPRGSDPTGIDPWSSVPERFKTSALYASMRQPPERLGVGTSGGGRTDNDEDVLSLLISLHGQISQLQKENKVIGGMLKTLTQRCDQLEQKTPGEGTRTSTSLPVTTKP